MHPASTTPYAPYAPPMLSYALPMHSGLPYALSMHSHVPWCLSMHSSALLCSPVPPMPPYALLCPYTPYAIPPMPPMPPLLPPIPPIPPTPYAPSSLLPLCPLCSSLPIYSTAAYAYSIHSKYRIPPVRSVYSVCSLLGCHHSIHEKGEREKERERGM